MFVGNVYGSNCFTNCSAVLQSNPCDDFFIMVVNMSRGLRQDIFENDFNPVQAMEKMAGLCEIYFREHPTITEPGLTYCNSTFDSFSCWPTTRAGSVARIACPELSVADPSANASKECNLDGSWSPANYVACIREPSHDLSLFYHVVPQTRSIRIIYDVGFTLTTIVLVLALTIFLQLKSLRCLRNSIHCNLFLGFICSNLTWLMLHNTLNHLYYTSPQILCKLLIAATTYLHIVPFYWMFVEGLYLFTIVVWAFSAQKFRLRFFILIGWVVPLAFTIAWAVAKELSERETCWLQTMDHADYIMHTSVLFLLASNVFFLVTIIWVLITKMKASNSLETQRTRKAVKATVVLLPLLGLTYLMFLKSPFDDPLVNSVFQHINAVLQTSQGLFVALFYCFLNGEVRTALRQKLNHFQDRHSLSRYLKSTMYSSPRRSSANNLTPYLGKSIHSRLQLQDSLLTEAGPETETSVLMMDRLGAPPEASFLMMERLDTAQEASEAMTDQLETLQDTTVPMTQRLGSSQDSPCTMARE